MSILIKGAKMPKSCDKCDFIAYDDEYEYECWCPIIRSNVEEYTENKPARCPLVDVATPHGRLIDADKYLNKVKYEAEGMSDDYGDVFINYTDWVLRKEPTVIESEEQDNE